MPDILIFKTKDTIPEGLREHAEEKEGAFHVSVVPNKVHSGFRDNNIALAKERDDLKGKLTPWAEAFPELTVDKVQEELVNLRALKQQVDDGTLKGSDAVNKAVEARVKSVQDGWDSTKKNLEKAAQDSATLAKNWEGKFKGVLLDQAVSTLVVAGDSKFAPSSLADIQARARAVWKVSDDGKLALMDGDVPVYSKKEPGTPMPIKEWLEELGKSAPHFLKPSAGGGASGGRGQGNFGMSQADFDKLPPAKRIELARSRGQS